MRTPNIPKGTGSMSKTINRCGSPQGICGLVGVSETCSTTLHQQGCSLMVSRGHCLVVPASFVDFSTATDQIEALDFRLGKLIEMWELIKLVTHMKCVDVILLHLFAISKVSNLIHNTWYNTKNITKVNTSWRGVHPLIHWQTSHLVSVNPFHGVTPS